MFRICRARVVDNAEILKPATRTAVNEKLKAHEQKTSDQIAVLTIPTIGDDSIEQFSTQVFESWKLGQKGKDNGVLLVIAPKDRKLRIEVGYGLEGTLTDVASSRIIRNVITPAFKAGDFDKGVSDGVDAIIGQLEGTLGRREARGRRRIARIERQQLSDEHQRSAIAALAARASCSHASYSASSACSRSWASSRPGWDGSSISS